MAWFIGHLLAAGGPRGARDRHRQAAGARRHRGAPAGDRPGRASTCIEAVLRAPRPAAARPARRRPGLRQRRRASSAASCTRSAPRSSAVSDVHRRHRRPRRARHRRRARAGSASTGYLDGLPAAASRSAARRCSRCPATSSSRPRWSARSPRENAARLDCPAGRRGRQRPDDPEAEAILAERGILVVPDVLANAGGVTVSYFEWVQDQQKYLWDIDRDPGAPARASCARALGARRRGRRAPRRRLAHRGAVGGGRARRRGRAAARDLSLSATVSAGRRRSPPAGATPRPAR